MSDWLLSNDRTQAVQMLQTHLTPIQMREVLDQDIETMVANVEQRDQPTSTQLADSELAEFLVDLTGIDLLRNRDLRQMLTATLDADTIRDLARWHGDGLPRDQQRRIEQIANRRWLPGKRWPRRFAQALGFPKIFAGIEGIATSPVTEDVEPHIALPDLHDFQQELVDRLRVVLNAMPGANRAILSLPTGAGKTRTTVETLLSWWGHDKTIKPYIIWMAQSEELCEQAVEAFREIWIDRGGMGARQTLRVFRSWGGYNALPEAYDDGVIVSSIQKLYEMIKTEDGLEELRTLAEDTAVVVVDEAHHTAAPSYASVLEVFGITFGSGDQSAIPLVGLTATPYRGNPEENQHLAERFHDQLLIPDALGSDPIGNLHERGVLSQVTHQVLETGRTFDLSDLEQADLEELGEFSDSFLRKVGRDPQRNALLLKTMLDLPPEWPVLFFGCSVEHARAMAVLLRRNGRSAAVITGKTRRATRRHLIEEFRARRLQVLCNFGVLTTGFNAPKIRALVIANPTASVVLYEQMIGRGVRGPLNGGTEKCLVIDLADNIARFQGQMAYTRMQEVWG